MNEHNIALLKKIIETQKEVCRCCIEAFGEEHETTKMNLNRLGRFIYLLARAERKLNINA